MYRTNKRKVAGVIDKPRAGGAGISCDCSWYLKMMDYNWWMTACSDLFVLFPEEKVSCNYQHNDNNLQYREANKHEADFSL